MGHLKKDASSGHLSKTDNGHLAKGCDSAETAAHLLTECCSGSGRIYTDVTIDPLVGPVVLYQDVCYTITNNPTLPPGEGIVEIDPDDLTTMAAGCGDAACPDCPDCDPCDPEDLRHKYTLKFSGVAACGCVGGSNCNEIIDINGSYKVSLIPRHSCAWNSEPHNLDCRQFYEDSPCGGQLLSTRAKNYYAVLLIAAGPVYQVSFTLNPGGGLSASDCGNAFIGESSTLSACDDVRVIFNDLDDCLLDGGCATIIATGGTCTVGPGGG